jgi:hypothetical protein
MVVEEDRHRPGLRLSLPDRLKICIDIELGSADDVTRLETE